MLFVSARYVRLPAPVQQPLARLIAHSGASRNAVNARRSRERLSMKNVLLHNIRTFNKPQKSAIY